MLCEDLTADDPLPPPLGKQWPARFLERHPGIMARRPKSLVSPGCGEPEDETSSPIPSVEAHTSEMTNEEPLLLDCQRFLERSTGTDGTPSQIPSTCTAPAAPSNVLTVASGTNSLDKHVLPPTATPADRPSSASSTAASFLSAIKSSLAEHRMTFSSRLT